MNYVQMPFVTFLGLCNTVVEYLNKQDKEWYLRLDKYIIRICENGTLELGYPEDKWEIS